MTAPLAFFYTFDPVYLIMMLCVMAFTIYAQIRVKGTYGRNIRIPSRGGLTGRDAAEAVMRQAGIDDVEITETDGMLTDHYDPLHKRLVLSSANYRGTSLGALGVAAHEAGHAIQHKVGYALFDLRMAVVPTTQFASRVLPWVLIGSYFVFQGSHLSVYLVNAVILCFAVITVFQLVTLPVEYDASRRAKVQLVSLGILDRDEMKGVNETLDAAALTYLAAFAGALINLLYWLSRRR